MKRIIIALIVVTTLQLNASAQAPYRRDNNRDGREEMMRSPEARAKKQTEKMAARLNLTNAQRKAVYEANLAKAKEMQPIIDQMRTVRQKAKDINAQYDAIMKETLTVDQYEQFKAMQEERKARRMEMRKGMRQSQPNDPQRDDREPEDRPRDR